MKDSTSRLSASHKSIMVRTPKDYPWKVLDALVEDLSNSLQDSEYESAKLITRKRDYDAYLELVEAWGPQSKYPCDISVDNVFAKYQVASLLKKYQFSGDADLRLQTAKEKFFKAEEDCYEFNHLGGHSKLSFLPDDWTLSAFTYAQRFLSKLLGEILPEREHLTEWSRHGPGANLDTRKGSASLYDKYENWPYSCTSGALPYARLAIQDDERWLGALEDSYRKKHGIEPWRILDQEVFWSNVLHVVPGNRITFVPKNSRTDRSIAIEPSMNLYLQLGVDGFLRRRLKRWGVDLDDQEKNQELARLGSKYWNSEDPFVTLDLAAASDTISSGVCKLLLPPQWYAYLHDLRSPVGELDGKLLQYEKISSMGNGFTFALESAIFTAVVLGVMKASRGHRDRGEFAVFGDDIVVRRSISDHVVTMLNLCGFSINHEKSFFEGPFRESCGADWFNGTPVRPVFLTQQPSTVMELWCDSNRIRRVLSLRRGMWRAKAIDLIHTWIPPMFSNIVGPVSDEDFDSYAHAYTPPRSAKHWVWDFQRLVVRLKPRKGVNEFLFRKLMHALRPSTDNPDEAAGNPWATSRYKWGGCRITGAGSRFAVSSPKAVTVGYRTSQTSYWSDEYTDLCYMVTEKKYRLRLPPS